MRRSIRACAAACCRGQDERECDLTRAALVAVALGANIVAPFDVNDPANANVVAARLPPGALGMFGSHYLLGTDPQGRDMLSAVIFGLRTSLLVGASSVIRAGCRPPPPG